MSAAPLVATWQLAGCAPGRVPSPAELDGAALDWHAASVPGTVAQALDLPLAGHPDLDAQDWWYRGRFTAPSGTFRLRFRGLATVAEVWLDGRPLLRSDNAFRSATADVDLGGEHELCIGFRALGPLLAARRPRPRWKTALVEAQHLRWHRTPLVGRIPGWTPRVAPVGPWRAITVEPLAEPGLDVVRVRAWVEAGVARVGVDVRVRGAHDTAWTLHVGDARFPLPVDADGTIAAVVPVPDAPRWWPHTAGEPVLVPVRLEGTSAFGAVQFELGAVGFRELTVDRDGGAVRLRINGRAHFCRGAVLTVEDVRTLDGPPGAARRTVERARALGADMLRVGGTMVWASDELLAACDALGVLLWHDLMLANMDYPVGDAVFRAELEAELDEQLARLGAHAAVAVVCGGSEIEQQAAMLGLPRSDWSGPFFQHEAPALVARSAPGAVWFPSTPTGGVLPFHTREGLTHYYGVGAYLRPLTDVRRAEVRFTPECLGFANVPDDGALVGMAEGGALVPHHPAWKAGVPRDNTAGWDFEDVRDHYLRERFGVDPVALRSRDVPRYLALSRVVTGELMLRTFAEWRRPGSPTGGALVWFWRDLRPGAGWGVVDHRGEPKAAAWYLRRAWARRAVLLTDEGLDGVAVHVHNETATPLTGRVQVELLRTHGVRVDHAEVEVEVAPWSAQTLSVEAMLGHFADPAYAYRFGPPRHDVLVARLWVDGVWVHDDVLYAEPGVLPMQPPTVLAAHTTPDEAGAVVLTLSSTAFLQAVNIAAAGWAPDDDHLDLAPGCPREVRFVADGPPRPFKAHVTALNLDGWLTVRG